MLLESSFHQPQSAWPTIRDDAGSCSLATSGELRVGSLCCRACQLTQWAFLTWKRQGKQTGFSHATSQFLGHLTRLVRLLIPLPAGTLANTRTSHSDPALEKLCTVNFLSITRYEADRLGISHRKQYLFGTICKAIENEGCILM